MKLFLPNCLYPSSLPTGWPTSRYVYTATRLSHYAPIELHAYRITRLQINCLESFPCFRKNDAGGVVGEGAMGYVWGHVPIRAIQR